MERLKFVLSLFIFVSAICRVENVRENVAIEDGEGFLLFSSNIEAEFCQLSRASKGYSFVAGRNKTHVLPSGEIVEPVVSDNPFECGFRVFGVKMDESEGQWSLTSTNIRGLSFSSTTTVSVLPSQSDKLCRESSNTWQCRKTDLDSDAKEEVDCDVELDNFKCRFFSHGKITETSVEHREEIAQRLKTPTITGAGSVIFECDIRKEAEVPNRRLQIKRCYMEHLTSGRKFSIQEGLSDSRYSTYKTHFFWNRCEFAIHQPVTDDEVGIWKITMQIKDLNKKGHEFDFTKTCKFQVAGRPEASLQNLMDRTSSVITVKTIKNRERIQCADNVFYPITLCYLTDDFGLYRYLRTSTDHEAMEEGNCGFDVSPGTWTCGFNGPTEDDLIIKQKFRVIKYNSEVIDEAVKRLSDGSTALECHLIGKRRIKSCAFQSPSGRFYRLPADNFTSAEYSYYDEDGGTLMNGDCGIKFPENVEVERGSWLCAIGTSLFYDLSTSIYHSYV